jgi:hypothetical protein
MTPIRDSRGTWIARLFIWLLLPLTLGLAITRQSLWIDEGYTVWFASHRSIVSFFSALIGSAGAPGDPQMVLYLLYMWVWVKGFGISELALRAANVPFAILLISSMVWASRRLLGQPNAWVFFCLSPFFWFYLNDARPYLALIAWSGIAVVALLAYLMYPTKYASLAPWCCLIALLLAWGTHILAAFLFPVIVIVIAATVTGDLNVKRTFLRDWLHPALWCLPAFIALACFYAWVSANGVNRGLRRPELSNFGYVLYEFLGFGGLGPPRNEIREIPHVAVFAPYWPWLLLGVIALVAPAFFLFRTRPPKLVWLLTVGFFVATAIAAAICFIENFQLLGRYAAALFPLFLIIPMLWLKTSLSSNSGQHGATAAIVALGVVWGISDARLTFIGKYGKESYREASAIAAARSRSDGATILWAADPHAAHYYGILVLNGQRTVEIGSDDGLDWPVRNRAVDARNWSSGEATAFLDASKSPTLLVLSKADLFDTQKGWRSLIEQRRPSEVASLIAFTVYEWQPQAATSP